MLDDTLPRIADDATDARVVLPVFQELTIEEIRLAAMKGVSRHVESLSLGFKEQYGADTRRNPWHRHVQGAIGEMAVAKFLGRYWGGLAGYGQAQHDVLGVEVRYTEHRSGRLILHDNDPDDAPFVLAIGQIGNGPRIGVFLHGWIFGRDGKLRDYWDTTIPSPAYCVPQTKLRAMTTLPGERT